MNNLELFEYSKKNPEKFFDEYYMFTEKHPDLDKYIKKTKDIKETLIAIKKIKDKSGAKETTDKLFTELHSLIQEYSNCSEFSCFVNACDLIIDDVRNDIELLKKITDFYLKNRELNDIVPSEWIQALLDNNASRKKGRAGQNKLVKILQRQSYKLVNNFEDFKKNKKSVAEFNSTKKVNEKFGMNFGKKTQGKALDLIIKKGDKIYFLEAKHMNTGGGGQNKQVLELIELVRRKSPKTNYYFVSFLDGTYFNKFFSGDKKIKGKNKTVKQNKDIIKSLKKNKNNYFLNTAGFKKLFG